MWTTILGLILNLLVKFLIDWLKARKVMTASALAGARAEFLEVFKYKFWLGPRRVEWASRAYSLMLDNLGDIRLIGAIGMQTDPAMAADIAVAGIKAKLLAEI